MNRDEWFRPKLKWLGRLALFNVPTLALLIAAVLHLSGPITEAEATAICFLTWAPFAFWLAYIPIIHWRERYRGQHAYTWGGFLFFETSCISKAFYWFMHVLPDRRAAGAYKELS